MAKKYNWKKWPILITVLIALINAWHHNHYQKNIALTFVEGLERMNYNPPAIDSVDLPLAFTVLAKESECIVNYMNLDRVNRTIVTLTPNYKLPLLWFLYDSSYHLDISQMEINKLSKFRYSD